MVFLADNWRPRRSVLFVPASNERAMAKVASLDCDGVIFDLEDSVAPEAQDQARAAVANLPGRSGTGRQERIVRVSAAAASEHGGDMAAAIACAPDAILLPKVEDPQTLVAAAARLEAAGCAAVLWAMIESPRAVIGAAAIAAATPRLEVLVVGPNDLAKSTGVAMRPGRAAMIPWLMQVVAAGRAFGLGILDGVWNAFRDAEGFASECAQGAELGFDGKTLIHPSQIDAANAAFSPSLEELERARAIEQAFALAQNIGKGAIQLEGEMVERLHLESARRLLQAFGPDAR